VPRLFFTLHKTHTNHVPALLSCLFRSLFFGAELTCMVNALLFVSTQSCDGTGTEVSVSATVVDLNTLSDCCLYFCSYCLNHVFAWCILMTCLSANACACQLIIKCSRTSMATRLTIRFLDQQELKNLNACWHWVEKLCVLALASSRHCLSMLLACRVL
jgi:hypothetical protein